MRSFDMSAALRDDVVRAIQRDYGTAGSEKSKGEYINKIQCPTCGKAEAFTNAHSPWVIKCGRANNCGETHHIKELFPMLFESWTERYQPKTEEARRQNPTAVADAYLREGRGFDVSKITGWYTQEYYHNHDTNEGSTTVRFRINGDAFWERVLDKPERFGKLKARAVGPYKGHVWVAPVFTMNELMDAERIVITEGIFDAIAWIQSGIVAVSNISSSNYPSEFLKSLADKCHAEKKTRPRICFAQDGDKAGRTAILKFAELAEKDGWKVSAAQPPAMAKNRDWNDLFQLGLMDAKHILDFYYYGDLVLAKKPLEKALLMYNKKGRREFWFSFGVHLYWFKLDIEKYQKETESVNIESLTEQDREAVLNKCGVIREIATATPKPLYFQENKVTSETWYYFKVETDEGDYKLAFSPKQLTSPGEFKNRLLAVKNAWWTGTPYMLESYLMDMTRNVKTVDTIDYIGYSKEHSAYIWNNVAVRDGRVEKLNSEDYFQFGRLSLKTLASSPEINMNTNKQQYDPTWPHHIAKSFGTTGVITTAFFVGSLFAEQIRQSHKSFPFFELVGEAGAGKTTLIEFLWKLLGREEHEGFDPQKATVAARARLFSQVSNMPVVLIESDREASESNKSKQFEWDELKTAFNGRAMRSRGVKNSGNDTYEPPFRGTILISQNEPVAASEAIMSRICHIKVTREFQSPETKIHADWLARVPMDSVSYFGLHVALNEKKILELFNARTEYYENQLLQMQEIRMIRIAENHSKLMAIVDCLGPDGLNTFTTEDCHAAKQKLISMAIERQQSINSDHPLVQEFWEAVDYIMNKRTDISLNHFGDNEYAWAINLKEFESLAGDHKLKIPEARVLKSVLKTSKTRSFIESNKAVRSKIQDGKTIKCWIFESKKGASKSDID